MAGTTLVLQRYGVVNNNLTGYDFIHRVNRAAQLLNERLDLKIGDVIALNGDLGIFNFAIHLVDADIDRANARNIADYLGHLYNRWIMWFQRV